jgi:hypothetical protein
MTESGLALLAAPMHETTLAHQIVAIGYIAAFHVKRDLVDFGTLTRYHVPVTNAFDLIQMRCTMIGGRMPLCGRSRACGDNLEHPQHIFLPLVI